MTWALMLVVSPVAEELVFRVGMLGGLLQRGWPAASALGLSTGVFALAHGLSRSPQLGLAVILPGLILGALYLRRPGWRACTAAHAAMNLIWLSIDPAWRDAGWHLVNFA